MRILKPDELAHLAWAIDPQYSALVFTAAATGCRFNELAALRTEHLDVTRRRLAVTEGLTTTDGRLGPTPTRTSRQVSLPRQLLEELHKHFALWPTGPDAYLFTAPKGGLLRHSNFRSRVWLPAVTASVGQPLRFEDLRHTHAATLIAAGEHPKVIQLRLGHRTLQATLDTYGHFFEQTETNLADGDYLEAFGSYLELRATTYSPAIGH